MPGTFEKLRTLAAKLIQRPATLHRKGEDHVAMNCNDRQLDWLPPVLGPSDLSSPYFLAMADRDAGWYFDRR